MILRNFVLYAVLTILLTPIGALNAQDREISAFVKQLMYKDSILAGRFPVYTEKGQWVFSEKPNWFSGFTAGELWHFYDLTQLPELRKRALIWCDSLVKYASLDNTHDMGFIFFHSCVEAYKHTGEVKYRDAAIKAARMLIKRYNTAGKFLRAWGKLGSNDREGLSIIDTMMNLELLFWAAQETKDFTFYDIAYTHALTTMRNHVREDFSSYHVVEYQPQTGDIVKKHTHQGKSDESTWARGQAWGIYGFAKAYQYTGDERFLNTSKRMAEYFLAHLKESNVPYWDLSLSGDTNTFDASAACIAACGILKLSELTRDKAETELFRTAFNDITKTVLDEFTFLSSKRSTEQGLLLHTVYHMHKGWGVDESYPCGDYYFAELFHHYKRIQAEDKLIQPVKSGRVQLNLNNDWYYLEDAQKDIKQLSKSLHNWTKVQLPHTWNVNDVFDEVAGYRRDVGWYQKEILVQDIGDAQFLITFEGVNLVADVYVNYQKVGQHIGGYVGFSFNVTPYLKANAPNIIHVRADNSINRAIVPSQRSDFNIFGGITRNVYLQILPKSYLANISISTPKVDEKKAEVVVKLNTIQAEKIGSGLQVQIKISDNTRKVVYDKVLKGEQLSPGENTNSFTISKPILWSTENPALYTAWFGLLQNGKLIDSTSERFGCRWFEFREKEAFYLNGKKLFLRGTHRHEDIAGFGNAIPDSLHRRDMQMIKDMGANFIRLAHYPQAPEVYRACDELGILVWDELPWCRGGFGDVEWQQNTFRLFKEQIKQNYNHPSIIMWSVGNESDWNPDYAGGDNVDSLTAIAKQLHNIAKELDPYRYTCTRKFEAAGKSVDVFSPSMWPGWYSDVYKSYNKVLERNREKYTRMFHAEYGGDSHVGRHTETPITGEGQIPESDGAEKANQIKLSSIANIGDWSESYMVNLFDWYLHNQEKLGWFSGSAQWIFRDFGTPLRPENPIPYVNQKGLVDLNNNKKDAYYVYQSYWVSNPGFVHIYSHTWDYRSLSKGDVKEIKVFSNCAKVELIVNNTSLGNKEKDLTKYPASGLVWNAKLIPGNNTIQALGYNSQGSLVHTDSMTVFCTGLAIDKPERVQFKQNRLANGNYLVTAELLDKNNNRCIDFQGRVYFSLSGSGKIIGYTGTPTNSPVIQAANGKAQIEIQTIPTEESVVELRTQDLKGFYYSIQH